MTYHKLLTSIKISRKVENVMGNFFTVLGILAGDFVISLLATRRVAMGIKADFEGLKTDVENMKTALNGALERIEQKVSELGEPDPDLTEIRTSIQGETARMSGILAKAPEAPAPDTGEASPGGFVEPGTSETTGVVTGDENAGGGSR